MIVTGGQSASFNYAAYDQATTLIVAATIYDVTTGTPVLFGSKVSMAHQSNGVYIGSFTPPSGRYYLVIMLVYTDFGFTTPDTQRAPKAENYDAPTSDTTKINFNYAAYDQASTLSITAGVTNVTQGTTSTKAMIYVANGVYFGQYVGVVGTTYTVTKYSSDPLRAPGSDSFQCYALASVVVTNYLSQATLTGPSVSALLQGHL